MTRDEFAQVSAYLSAAVGKPMPRDQLEVYYDLLKDLPGAAVAAAARQALCESRYPTIPPVGTIRQLAVAATRGRLPTWAEAWELALRAVRRFGVDREREGLASLPPVVAHAARCLGWRSLCDATDLETPRAQFRDAYGPIADREEHLQALPEPVRRAIEQAARRVFKALPGPTEGADDGRGDAAGG
ncbi:MAG: hypothetical protein IT429_14935 [Gemmataceae bacterium]|nr:hypothetical protein [Gemmataceae bacterium]